MVIYNFHVFDNSYQKEHIAAQPFGVDFDLSAGNVRGYIGIALVLINWLVSISSDWKRMFDLILTTVQLFSLFTAILSNILKE